MTDMTRPTLDRRKFVLGLAFAGAAGAAAARQPRERIDYLGKKKLENIIPKNIGRWSFVTNSGLVIPPEDQLSQMLYSDLLTRVYSDGQSPPIMLLIAQSSQQTGVLQVHRPEVCYPAGGYTLSPVLDHSVPLGSSSLLTNELTATSDGLIEHIIYWTRIGDQMPQTWAQQRIAVARDNIAGRIPDAVLVRVSTVNPDKAASVAHMDEFVRTMLTSLAPAGRKVLIA